MDPTDLRLVIAPRIYDSRCCPVWIATHRARQQVTQREAAARRDGRMLRWISWLFFPPSGGLCTRCTPRCDARRSRRCRLRSRRAATRCRLSAVTSFLVVMVPGSDGGVTVGYASHSCRGRRTETRRSAAAAAALLATVRPALPFPFPSLPTPRLFLSLPLSFPFLFVLSSRSRRRRRPRSRRGSRSRFATERNTSSSYSSHTLRDVPYVRRDTSVCFCPATTKSRVSCVTLNYPPAIRLEDHR